MEILKTLGVGGVNKYFNINRKSNAINFGSYSDSFENRSLDRFTNEYAIKKMIAANPKIKSIVKNFNPEFQLNMTELKELLQHHATDTKNITRSIIENLPFSLQNKVDTKAIEEASYLHDLGKVLIPKEVLNKPGRLNDAETKIMHTHSELSYELLKNSNLDEKTLKLIRNHHQNANKTGYPWVGKDFNADINLQILSLADKYSALTENRVYKQPLSPQQALTIIYQDVKDEKLNPLVFNALVKHVNLQKPIEVA